MSFLHAKIKWQTAKVELGRGIISQQQFDVIDAEYAELNTGQVTNPNDLKEPLVAPETHPRGRHTKAATPIATPAAPPIPPVDPATGETGDGAGNV